MYDTKTNSELSNQCIFTIFVVQFSGSTFNAAIGVGSLKEQQEHFQRAIITHDPKVFTEERTLRLEHGILHEVDAKATILSTRRENLPM